MPYKVWSLLWCYTTTEAQEVLPTGAHVRSPNLRRFRLRELMGQRSDSCDLKRDFRATLILSPN